MSILSLRTNLMASNAARNLTAHYGGLSTSVRRLSSGLRVETAADDAAGLSIRELMRANIAALNQGICNANDAISLIQTADGALQIIDEKLIRMKELAEQAATGTYSSDQRLMIDSEFQAMASEIQRIATATDFNGVKLLDGSLSGGHDGSGLVSTGALKVHFGAGNDNAEDYYYISIGDATLQGLGLAESTGGGGGGGGGGTTAGENLGNLTVMGDLLVNGGGERTFTSGIVSFAVIPKGTKNLWIHTNDGGPNDDIQLFTTSGTHIAGTALSYTSWTVGNGGVPVNASNVDSIVITAAKGFDDGASYDGSVLNGTGATLPFASYTPGTAGNIISYNGMTIGYSGDGNPVGVLDRNEYLTIDETTEDLILIISGNGGFGIEAAWDYMPAAVGGGAGGEDVSVAAISIETQELAQKALERLDDAIIAKDKIRAHLGATQNRLENTVSNLQIQVENLQAAESRISDTDVATEMTEFVRNQVLTQASVAMLAQANTLPSLLARLLE